MIEKYFDVFIIYGGKGKKYATALQKRIKEASKNERYPLKANIIMEKIMTEELLSDVIGKFRDSEFCVAFLTADDCFETEKGTVNRLRQNVIFELGMALMQLGRKRCFLLSDFDPKKAGFELPSDMKSLNIKKFNPENLNEVIDSILEKILTFTPDSDDSLISNSIIPQYKNLFFRDDYYVQYEDIFKNKHKMQVHEGIEFFKKTLDCWIEDCKTLHYFDEKCMFLLERLGFLPIFGNIPEVYVFFKKASTLVESYSEEDIHYYDNNVQILNFVKNLVNCVIEYTQIKTTENVTAKTGYEKLLRRFNSVKYANEASINPLILLVYYDYLGLTYLKIYTAENNMKHLENAMNYFQKALDYVCKVDMSLQIWEGFLDYNIARTYSKMGDIDNAIEYFEKAISIREGWIRNSKYNITTRNALSYEYFLARIYFIDQKEEFHIITKEQTLQEFKEVENELNTYSDVDEKLDQLVTIRKILTERKKMIF